LLVRCSGGTRSRDRYHPVSASDFMLMFTHNLAQSAANSVPDDCASKHARCDKTGSESIRVIFDFEHADHKQMTTLNVARFFDLLKFRSPDQAAAFRKSKAFTAVPSCHVERSRDISKYFWSEIVRDSSTSVGMTIWRTGKVFRSWKRTKDFANIQNLPV
jgi:hypothetical protein